MARVGTKKHPRAAIAAASASVRKIPCSMDRAPASIAQPMASPPSACTMTGRRRRPASLTAAARSSNESSGSNPPSDVANTPLVATSLIQSAPERRARRTTFRISSGPSARCGGLPWVIRQRVVHRAFRAGPGQKTVRVASCRADGDNRDLHRRPGHVPGGHGVAHTGVGDAGVADERDAGTESAPQNLGRLEHTPRERRAQELEGVEARQTCVNMTVKDAGQQP